MQKRLNTLLEKVDESDRVELVMVNNAFVAATNNYKAAATTANVKEWRALKEEMSLLIASLEEKYDIGEAAESQQITIFSSKIAVHRWLEDNGWQIARSQFYAHCKDGLLRPGKDGKYHLKAVEKYATLHVKKAETGQKVNTFEEQLRERQLKAKAEKEEIDLQLSRMDLEKRQGKVIPREEHELAIVSRAVAFMAHLNHTVQSEVQNWIELVDGDQQKAPQLVEAISREIEQRMGDFAIDAEFDVIMEAN